MADQSLLLPLLLSMLAGYVDTAGYMALQGLFTAHVTGNFVTIGAALVHGTSGVVTKVLALPVFCLIVFLTRRFVTLADRQGAVILRELMMAQTVLLLIGGAIIIIFGPFVNADLPLAVLAGVVLVAAMAIQNAAHRVHLSGAPPSTLMTGTTTQVMLDFADLCFPSSGDVRAVIRVRLRRMSLTIAVFALGCGLAALALASLGKWCFVLPPVLGMTSAALVHFQEKWNRGHKPC